METVNRSSFSRNNGSSQRVQQKIIPIVDDFSSNTYSLLHWLKRQLLQLELSIVNNIDFNPTSSVS